jgi:hypothetical protein
MKMQLEGHMTGEIVHGLLAPGRIWSGKLTGLDVTFSHKAGSPECLVFQEEKWIRRLLRGLGFEIPYVPPGSYLKVEDEKWNVEVSINKEGVFWNAISTVTGRRFHRFSISFPLDFTNDLEEERKRILRLIVWHIGITLDEVGNLLNVEEYLTKQLESWRFRETNPPCELSIEHSDTEYSFTLKLDSEIRDFVIATVSYQIEEGTTREEVIEGFNSECENGWISQYDIVNMEEFTKQFNEVLENYDFSAHVDNDGIDAWHVSLYEEDGLLMWKAEDALGDEVDGGLLSDNAEWLMNESIEVLREVFKSDFKGMHGTIANLDDVLNDDLEEVIEEIREMHSPF